LQPRTALLAGASGLVGRALLSLLLASKHYRSVRVLLRRTPPDIEVDFARLPATFQAVAETPTTRVCTVRFGRYLSFD
jgi:uncharacterized protein YbjT (DUF2867 family)